MFRPRAAQVALVVHYNKETTLELDSRSDTSVLGGGALVVSGFNEPFNVQGYDPSLGTKTYKTITGAVGYCDPVSVRISRTSFKSSLKLTFCCWEPC